MKAAALSILAALVLGAGAFAFADSAPVVEVWRTASCGCCGAWVRHLQESGFATRVHFVEDTSAARREAGVPEAYGSCHTAKVGGYALEGHVPAAEIRRLLAEKPRAVGLAVPGMPMGSPGMEGPAKMPYDVMLVRDGGKASVYRHY
jgi:hypothetical protein